MKKMQFRYLFFEKSVLYLISKLNLWAVSSVGRATDS